MDYLERLAVLLFVIAICTHFVSLDVDVVSNKLTTSYSINRLNKDAQVCINIRPQALYVWDSDRLINLTKLDYGKFSKPDELTLKVDLTILDMGGKVRNFMADYQFSDSSAGIYFRNEYLCLTFINYYWIY